MRYLVMAFGVTLGASVILFGVLNLLLGLDDHVAEGVAGLPFIASHHVCEMLEREHARRAPPEKRAESIYTFAGFAMSWKWAVILGTMTLFGVMELASGYAGMTVALIGSSEEMLVSKMAPITIPVVVVANYLVGRMIGTRCASHGLATIVLVGLIGSGITRVFDFSILSGSVLRTALGEPATLDVFLIAWLGGAALFWVPGFIGYRRGRRRRLGRYLTYLVGVLPKDTRETLVSLAYSEAQSLVSRTRRPEITGLAPGQ
jgi:hypothetical protein